MKGASLLADRFSPRFSGWMGKEVDNIIVLLPGFMVWAKHLGSKWCGLGLSHILGPTYFTRRLSRPRLSH